MNELPDGFVIRLAEKVRVRDGGRTLVGGAPLRVSFLSDAARKLFVGRTVTVVDGSSRILAETLLASGIGEPVVESLEAIDLSEVTCVIPVRDRAASLARLLDSLAGLPQTIVVDDCSQDPEAVAEIARRHRAQLVPLDRNVGPAAARNVGLRAVTTPYVLFVDSDVVITDSSIRALLKHFHDPRVAAVAPRIHGLGESKRWIARYEDARSSLDLGAASALVRPHSAVSWVPSAVLLARVEALDEGFDSDMTVGEDVDLMWRLADAGWRIRYDANVVAHHDHRTRLIPWLGRKAFYGLSADVLAVRHGRKVAPAILSPTNTVIAVAALAQRRWSLPLAAGAVATICLRLVRKMGRSQHPRLLAAELTAQGVSATLMQLMALMLRHWWPLSAVGCILSKRIRRAVVVSAAIDAAIEYRRASPRGNLAAFVIGRRLDDLAYGVGVWVGAVRGRSLGALLPDFSTSAKR